MKKYDLKDFTKGWIVGDFNPSIIQNISMEVSIKRYNRGDSESAHHHKIATELTCVIEGKISMNGEIFMKDDIVEILPNEIVKFEALEDTVTVVIKTPSVRNDKYE